MNKFLQILCYAISFLFTYGIGNFLGILISWEAHYLQIKMQGMPMPLLLKFFSENHFIVSYFFLFPWLCFMGLPLFPFTRASYWDANLFLLRYSVFMLIELILLCFFSFIFYMPNIQPPGGIGEDVPPLTWIEISMRVLFWLTSLLIVVAGLWRALGNRKPKGQRASAIPSPAE